MQFTVRRQTVPRGRTGDAACPVAEMSSGVRGRTRTESTGCTAQTASVETLECPYQTAVEAKSNRRRIVIATNALPIAADKIDRLPVSDRDVANRQRLTDRAWAGALISSVYMSHGPTASNVYRSSR